MTLEKVLFTVLKANEKDIELIEKARQKNTGGFLSYFYSGANTIVPRPLQPRMDFMAGPHFPNNDANHHSFPGNDANPLRKSNGGSIHV